MQRKLTLNAFSHPFHVDISRALAGSLGGADPAALVGGSAEGSTPGTGGNRGKRAMVGMENHRKTIGKLQKNMGKP